jgi:acyl-coenzyme A synthetase/AMP-(fatty) acid ligase
VVRSGDVLTADEDGYLWFRGADDLINASSYRISP